VKKRKEVVCWCGVCSTAKTGASPNVDGGDHQSQSTTCSRSAATDNASPRRRKQHSSQQSNDERNAITAAVVLQYHVALSTLSHHTVLPYVGKDTSRSGTFSKSTNTNVSLLCVHASTNTIFICSDMSMHSCCIASPALYTQASTSQFNHPCFRGEHTIKIQYIGVHSILNRCQWIRMHLMRVPNSTHVRRRMSPPRPLPHADHYQITCPNWQLTWMLVQTL
jgi:hypothetical protein